MTGKVERNGKCFQREKDIRQLRKKIGANLD
jgi:hypothetical protein